MATKEFDLLVWGVTGFTGNLCCKFLAKQYGLCPAFKYAIAGRNKSKLEEVERMMVDVAKLHNKTNGGTGVAKVVADVSDEASIVAAVKNAKCVIALAGPYALCGEAVVKACAENGTHYVDVTGEMEWVVRMDQMYGSAAKANKCKIVPGNGALFLPNELGMIFLNQMCETRNCQLKSVRQSIASKGSGISGGTLRSMLNSMDSVELSSAGSRFSDPYLLCAEKPSQAVIDKNKSKVTDIFYNKQAEMWCSQSFVTPMVANYIRWSNQSQGYAWGKEAVIQASHLSSSVWRAILSTIVFFIFPFAAWIFSKIPMAGSLIPAVGSATFDGDELSKDRYMNIFISAEAVDKTTKATKSFDCKVSCPYEAYNMTGITVVETALAVCFDETPSRYGFVSASGGIGAPLIARMEKHNITAKLDSVK